MAIDIVSTSAVAAVNKVATQNQGDQREIQRVNPSSSSNGIIQNDRLSLTAAAERLRQAEDHSVRQPVVDTQRMDALREQIVNGRYHINASRVADKLLSFETSLNGAARAR